MSRVFKYVRFLVIFISLLVVIGNNPVASANSWIDSLPAKLSDTLATWPTYFETTCSGSIGLISVHGWPDLQEACIYGKTGGVQIAKYQGSGLYAISFPLDTSFTQLRDPCSPGTNCMYGQLGDTLLIHIQKQNGIELALVKDFSKHLVKYTDDRPYYKYEGTQEWKYVSFGSRSAKVAAMAVSPNGKWGVVEVKSSGFVRINLQTLEYKRVVAPSGDYGYGTDPIYELSITNDGAKLAIVGWNTSVAVYELDDECGDTLTDASTNYFSPYTYACPRSNLNIYEMMPGFRVAQLPKFSENGTKLSLYVYANNHPRFVWIGQDSIENGNTPPLYVAFGDSFSSGEGETNDIFYLPATNTVQNRCHISTRSYPYLIGKVWNLETKNRACSGSRVNDVRVEADAVAQEATRKGYPSFISVGIGGNDIELMGKLKTCLNIGQCEWASIEKRYAGAEEIKALFPKIVELINSFKLEYPDISLAMIGYPSVVNTADDARCGVLVSTMLNKEERRYMNESIKYLNQVLKAAASYTKITYVNIEDALVGERLCDSSERAMNSVRLGDDIAPLSFLSKLKLIGAESFHPTPRGHQLVADTIQRGGMWTSSDCNNCQFDLNQLEPPHYWTDGIIQTDSIRQQNAKEFLATTDSKSGQNLSFKFLKGTFLPGSKVVLEIHSEVRQLGTYTADENGALSGEVTVPLDLSGYHTIHAYGDSQSGIAYDLYQMVSIETDTPVSELHTETSPPQPRTVATNQITKEGVLGSANTGHITPIKSAAKTNIRKVSSTSNSLPTYILFIIATTITVGVLIAAWFYWQNRRGT